MFKTNYLLICDEASVENGKLNVRGQFDTISANSFPAIHPKLAFVFGFEVPENQRSVNLTQNLIITKQNLNGDSEIIGNLENSFTETSFRRQVIIDIMNFPLSEPGKYIFNISIGGESIGETYFNVVQA